MTDVPLNPFSCWRRGHRSKKFGFLFNQIIQPTQHDVAGWAIGSERQIYTSPRLKLALQHLHSGLQVNVFPKEAPAHGSVHGGGCNGSVEHGCSKTSRSISRVLDVQYLHSTNKQKNQGKGNCRRGGKVVRVREAVCERSEWFGGAHLSRRNNLGVLSMAVVHCSGEDELEFLSAVWMKLSQITFSTSRSKNSSLCNCNSWAWTMDASNLMAVSLPSVCFWTRWLTW